MHAGMAGRGNTHLARLNHAARGFQCLDGAARIAPYAGDLAILDDVDAERIGRARIAPGDGVVARGAAAPLQGRAQHRIADVVFDVERRAEFLGLGRFQPLIVDSAAPVGVHVALEHLNVVHGVREHHDAARREHDVVIEHLREVLPQLHRMIVERRAFVEQVIRADDRGVAAGVAAADPALLEDRDIRQSVFLGQIVRSAETVTAAADDDGVVACLGLGLAPLRLPTRDASRDCARSATVPKMIACSLSILTHEGGIGRVVHCECRSGPQILVLRIIR